MVTLDGEERDLITDDIVISVADKAVALGGVMGGANTEIDNNSKTVVLEVASLTASLSARPQVASTFALSPLLALKKAST